MEKAQLPLIAELSLDVTEDYTEANVPRKFSGTSNQRHLRVLAALQRGPLTREQLDRVAGASNGPELVAALRRRGLALPCYRVPVIDRDGFVVRSGVYALTTTDIHIVNKALSKNRGRV